MVVCGGENFPDVDAVRYMDNIQRAAFETAVRISTTGLPFRQLRFWFWYIRMDSGIESTVAISAAAGSRITI